MMKTAKLMKLLKNIHGAHSPLWNHYWIGKAVLQLYSVLILQNHRDHENAKYVPGHQKIGTFIW